MANNVLLLLPSPQHLRILLADLIMTLYSINSNDLSTRSQWQLKRYHDSTKIIITANAPTLSTTFHVLLAKAKASKAVEDPVGEFRAISACTATVSDGGIWNPGDIYAVGLVCDFRAFPLDDDLQSRSTRRTKFARESSYVFTTVPDSLRALFTVVYLKSKNYIYFNNTDLYDWERGYSWLNSFSIE